MNFTKMAFVIALVGFSMSALATTAAPKAAPQENGMVTLVKLLSGTLVTLDGQTDSNPLGSKLFRRSIGARSGLELVAALDSDHLDVTLLRANQNIGAARLKFRDARASQVGTRVLTYKSDIASVWGPGKLIAKVQQVATKTPGQWRTTNARLMLSLSGMDL